MGTHKDFSICLSKNDVILKLLGLNQARSYHLLYFIIVVSISSNLRYNNVDYILVIYFA